jgi:cation diffusion facilitator CzcD-associated flavoprotein CzcO
MTNVQGEPQRAGAKADLDAVIIGARFSGMYMLHSLRDKLDLNVTVLEAGDGVGGTWYWNRYPGARCDSDSYIYCYTFDKNLLQEWNWSEFCDHGCTGAKRNSGVLILSVACPLWSA